MKKNTLNINLSHFITPGNSLAPKLKWIHSFKKALEFRGNCLRQIFKRFINTFYTRSLFFGAVKLTKNVDPDKCGYSGYDIGFDARP